VYTEFALSGFRPRQTHQFQKGHSDEREEKTVNTSIAIIGAGIAGLSAGCYLQMNGYETHIFEAHAIPGGLCTGWRRNGYTFDGCIHWLAGSGPASPFHQMWGELLDLSGVRFVDHDLRFDIELDRADRHGDRVFHLYADLDRLEGYLKDIAPEDASEIDDFVGSIRTLQKYELPSLWDIGMEIRTWRHKLKLLKYLPFLVYAQKWSKITNVQFAERLKNPFLRAGFRRFFADRASSILGMTMQLAMFDQKCAGFPIGGSLPFAQKIAARYESLGGTIHYRAPVRSILVEHDRAVGIVLENGQSQAADTVISAADGHWTILKALNGQYVDPSIRDLYDGKTLEVFESMILVSLGIARTFDTESHLVRFPLPAPISVADGSCFERMEAHVYNYDPTLAPPGKTVVTVTLYTRNHAYWTELRDRDRKAYQAAKDKLARQVIERLDARFGGIKENVEVVDVATPATFIRYTRNWQGSYQGWYPSSDLLTAKPLSKTLPGLERFYMIGQWVEPGGGLPIVAQAGRNVAQMVCKRDGKRFRSAQCARRSAQIVTDPDRC
jgi:phytoene dehydrogenase-like protein